MKEYLTLCEGDLTDLQDSLNARAEDGWRCIEYDVLQYGENCFYSAIMEREKEKPVT